MANTLVFKLVRPAERKGGDRYEAPIEGDRPFVVYVPQRFSREKGAPSYKMKITFEDYDGKEN